MNNDEKTDVVLKIRCNQCNQDLPATTGHFYPSHLKEGRKQCKACHSKHNGGNDPAFRQKLNDVAEPIQQNTLRFYRTLNAIATRLGWSKTKVERNVYERNIPVFKFLYNNTGICFAIHPEDAEILFGVDSLDGQNYVTIRELAERSGRSMHQITSDIHRGALKAHKFPGKHYLEFRVDLDDAKAYIASYTPEQDQSRSSSSKEGERELPRTSTGTFAQCGACGTTEGKIICDADSITKEWRGYLCAPCYRLSRLVRDYQQGDPERIRNVLDYVERTMLH